MNKNMITIGLVLALAVTAHAQQEQAQQILKETGVTGLAGRAPRLRRRKTHGGVAGE